MDITYYYYFIYISLISKEKLEAKKSLLYYRTFLVKKFVPRWRQRHHFLANTFYTQCRVGYRK